MKTPPELEDVPLDQISTYAIRSCAEWLKAAPAEILDRSTSIRRMIVELDAELGRRGATCDAMMVKHSTRIGLVREECGHPHPCPRHDWQVL